MRSLDWLGCESNISKLNDLLSWITQDIHSTVELHKNEKTPEIVKVIFNPPATIVLWSDGTKTVVKTHGCDEFDPEKGLAMAISKKALGNHGSYYNEFTKWIKKYEEEHVLKVELTFKDLAKACREAADKLSFGFRDFTKHSREDANDAEN